MVLLHQSLNSKIFVWFFIYKKVETFDFASHFEKIKIKFWKSETEESFHYVINAIQNSALYSCLIGIKFHVGISSHLVYIFTKHILCLTYSTRVSSLSLFSYLFPPHCLTLSLSSPGWPDVRIKSSPIFHKVALTNPK